MYYDGEIQNLEFGRRRIYDREFKKKKFSKQQRNEQEPCEDFATVCKGLMKTSLITGFPEIAESSGKRRTIKLMVFLFCTAAFFYQTGSFLKIYLAYPTVVSKENFFPETLEAPAVTICSRNRLSRVHYCLVFPDHCETIEDKEEFCKLYPNYCPSPIIKPIGIINKVVKEEYRTGQDNSLEILNLFAVQNGSSFIFSCDIIGPQIGKVACKPAKRIQVQRYGFPYRCFSVNAVWGSREAPQIISQYDAYVIVIDMRIEEFFEPDDPITAYVHIHDPRYQANPFFEGIPLQSGILYEVQASVERRENLPAPYSSSCTDYVKLWEKNQGYGPLTKEQCIQWCEMNYFKKKYGCIPAVIHLPHNDSVCRAYDLYSPRNISIQCSDSCFEPCKMDYYKLNFKEEKMVGDVLCPVDDIHCNNAVLTIEMKLGQIEITRYKQEPKYPSIELFSYIGGYMGMWLGISFVSLFDLGDMSSLLITYPFRKWNNQRRRRRKTNDTTHTRSGFNN